MSQTGKKLHSSRGFALVMGLLAVLCLGVICRQEYKIYRVEEEAALARERVAQLQIQRKDLQEEHVRLYDVNYIEKLARENHNMVGKDEIPLFIVEDRSPASAQSSTDKS